MGGFSSLTGIDDSLAEKLVGEGFLSYDDLSIIEPDALMEMGELTEEQASEIVAQAEVKAQEAEQAAALERRRQREQERIDAATAAAEAAERAALEAQGGGETAAEPAAPEQATPEQTQVTPPAEVGDSLNGGEVSDGHAGGAEAEKTAPDEEA